MLYRRVLDCLVVSLRGHYISIILLERNSADLDVDAVLVFGLGLGLVLEHFTRLVFIRGFEGDGLLTILQLPHWLRH